MFPFWLELSSSMVEPLAVLAVTFVTWLFRLVSPRGC